MADSAAATPNPSPPPSEPSAAAAAQDAPPQPAPAPEPKPEAKQEPAAVAGKKRKPEEMGFHHSPYYKIRATVAALRPRFLEVYQATDFRNSDAAREILKEIQVIMELSVKMRLSLSPADKPVKPSGKPSAGAVKDELTETIPSEEKYEVPQTGQAARLSNNALDNAPRDPDNLETGAENLPEETQPGNNSSEKDCPKQLDENSNGSYVIGGSPIGWNFLVWPGNKVVYYGLTKEEFRAHQSAL